jgi:hypothetical protein
MKKTITILTILALVALVVGRYVSTRPAPTPADTTSIIPVSDEHTVRELVVNFGTHLKNVSLLAEPEAVISSIQEEYAPFVSPILMSEWVSDLSRVPGRTTSSPWPERIEIKSMENKGVYYEIVADVIEVAQVESSSAPAEVSRTTVYITVAKINSEWLIVEYQTSMQ